MAPVREVAFELECFEWAEERLEVAGRWKGLGQRKLNRPVLTVDTDSGRRKRIVALPGEGAGVAGETWRASFSWPGDPAEITGAALEVGGSLVVDLPLPDRRRRRRRRPSQENHTDEALRAEVAALRGQVDRLRAELAGREREMIALRAELDESESESELDADAAGGPGDVVAGADERTMEIERLAGQLERLEDERAAGTEALTAEVERLTGERDQARADHAAAEADMAAERERWQAELDELREAFSDAAVEAESARDRHRAELEALEGQLRAERAATARLSAQLAAGPDDPAAEGAPPAAPEQRPAAGPPTVPMPPPATGDAAETEAPGEAAVLDAPGPLRAGSRPTSPAAGDPEPTGTLVPAWLRGTGAGDADGEDGERREGPLQALKERFDGLIGSNGHSAGDDPEPVEVDVSVPRPRRTAAAARARAGATVAARRSAAEVWALRVVAAIVVAILLIAMLLILTRLA